MPNTCLLLCSPCHALHFILFFDEHEKYFQFLSLLYLVFVDVHFVVNKQLVTQKNHCHHLTTHRDPFKLQSRHSIQHRYHPHTIKHTVFPMPSHETNVTIKTTSSASHLQFTEISINVVAMGLRFACNGSTENEKEKNAVHILHTQSTLH